MSKRVGFVYGPLKSPLYCETYDDVNFYIINGNWEFSMNNTPSELTQLTKVLDNMDIMDYHRACNCIIEAYDLGWRAKRIYGNPAPTVAVNDNNIDFDDDIPF